MNVIREIIGWLLTGLGLFAFLLSYAFLSREQLVQSAIVAGIGFALFRGGLALVRLASAIQVVERIEKSGMDQKSRMAGGPSARGSADRTKDPLATGGRRWL